MTQGEAVARLNVFAFIFLPMSFAASIFGMTNFSISATWYPLWAVIALIIVISGPLVFPVDKLYRYASRPRWLKGKKEGILQECLMNSSIRTPGFESSSNYQLLVGLDSQGAFAPNQGQPQKGAASQIAADQRLRQDTWLLKKLRFQRRQSSSSTLQSLPFTRSFHSSSVTLQGSSTNSTIWNDGHLEEEKKGVEGDKDEGILQAHMLPSNAVSLSDGPALKKFDSDFQQNFDISTDSHQSHLFAAFPVYSKRPRSHASDSRVATKKSQSQPKQPPSALVRVNGNGSDSIQPRRSAPET
ncbi:hypothetical protein N7528_008164 [Penicillium herquei]|nr:hypothetical protein N7528_008164 [Penicillium herquei]